MGKTVAASLFQRYGIPVWNADSAVHQLLAKKGKAVAAVAALFPEALRDHAIDRAIVAKHVFADPQALAALEKIIHPLLEQCEVAFIRQARQKKLPIIVLDIPLLFELHKEDAYDAVIVVTASPVIQRHRALKRRGMTEERLRFIKHKQMPDAKKRRKADHIIISGLGKAVTARQIKALINRVTHA